jgi:hypothetical protein
VEPIIPAPGNGPWRILILDRDPADPKWIVATVATPADVIPAVTSPGGEFATLAGETGQWLRGLLGHPVHLTPMTRAHVWVIGQAGSQ